MGEDRLEALGVLVVRGGVSAWCVPRNESVDTARRDTGREPQAWRVTRTVLTVESP